MSTQPMSEATDVVRSQCVSSQNTGEKCKHGMFAFWCGVCSPVEPRVKEHVRPVDILVDSCPLCGAEVEKQQGRGRPRRFCNDCRQKSTHHGSEYVLAQFKRDVRNENTAVAIRHLRAFKYMSFDGRWEGPDNVCFTVVTGLRKDHGYHPMPIDVHVQPVELKNNITAAELHSLHEEEQKRWLKLERLGVQQGLQKPKTNFCPTCLNVREEYVAKLHRNWWIEKGKVKHEDVVTYTNVKHVTRGKYVLQGHVCTNY